VDASYTQDDPQYPARLRELKRPPVVHVRGTLPTFEHAVAIVGARRASEDGRSLARRIAYDLAERGVTIVSGGAIGIDSGAHRGAIDAQRPTVIVLPTPLDRPYPPSNRRLFEEALALGGAWVSENSPVFGRSAFSRRNRVIAALAEVVVVIEAKERSGTMYTLRAARSLSRIVAAVPWGFQDSRGVGCVNALRAGAIPVRDAADVLALLGLPRRRPRTSAEVCGDLASVIAHVLSKRAMALEELAIAVGTEVPKIMVALTSLELAGRVRARPDGRFERS
jgi:DNA processing protein